MSDVDARNRREDVPACPHVEAERAKRAEIVVRLRVAAALYEASGCALMRDASTALALARELEGPSPPTLASIEELGKRLFRSVRHLP